MSTLRQLRSRLPTTGLNREFYVDEDLFQLDLELIFYREWLFAAHDAELPEPGCYVTLQVGAYPIVLVRDRAGGISAFVNSCRHRGAHHQVAAASRGGRRRRLRRRRANASVAGDQ